MKISPALFGVFLAFPTFGQKIALTPELIQVSEVTVSQVHFLGKKALRLSAPTPSSGQEGTGKEIIAVLKQTRFKNGTIEVDVAGERANKNDQVHRGFIGIAFRVQEVDGRQTFECFELRPTNGRADDQVRRNHSVQYSSPPAYPWSKLREAFPATYESYADLEEGKWTKMKLVVRDEHAQLYINGATQPCLLVNDLKNGISTGAIGLKTDVTTIAHFRNLKVNSF